ncbi:alpha/beta fold hydrolase [Ferrimonas senticii]|uniref:alpha/beta fold hydrolase n=1 Tax=Ferrimonas senticii TaxID=394566 RepID=UPI0003F899D4|nr:alpha/beta fold hydrolase [Ferrimonas senticii]
MSSPSAVATGALPYVQSGTGPTVVLLHGLFGDLDNLRSCANALVDAGFSAIRLALPGHNDAPLEGTFDFASAAARLEQLRQQLQIQQWSLLGHSLGGKVAMTYAQRYPERTAALLVADIAPVAYPPRHTTILQTLPQIDTANLSSRTQAQQQLQQAGIDLPTAAFICKNLVRAEPQGFRWRIDIDRLIASYPQIIANIPDNPPYLGKVLMVKGAESDYILPAHRDAIASRFSNARAHIINGAGHMLHAQKPEAFNRLAVKFFQL